MSQIWKQLAAKASVDLTADAVGQLERYLTLLVEANRRMNLTRIVDPEAARLGHIADAFTLLPHLPRDGQVADVGSGGGVPGIPLAIVLPEVRFTLIESTKKKAVFLESAAAELGLANVSVAAVRAEDAGLSPLRERFDAAVARAVAELAWIAEWCLPLVRVGGVVLAMKGERAATELPDAAAAIAACGGGKPVVHPADLPGSDHRVIVAIPKTKPTYRRYPRPATTAKGRPISGGRPARP